jgi:hypothetical protein
MRAGPTFIIPALVVFGDLGFVVWLNAERRGLSGLGPLLIFMFVVVPLSLVFLAAYTTMILRLRAAARPRGEVAIIAWATLAGLAAGATTMALMFGALVLEAKLAGR